MSESHNRPRPVANVDAVAWRDMIAQSHAPGDWFQGATDDLEVNNDTGTAGVPYRNHPSTGERQDRCGHVRSRPLSLRAVG